VTIKNAVVNCYPNKTWKKKKTCFLIIKMLSSHCPIRYRKYCKKKKIHKVKKLIEFFSFENN